MGVEMDSVQAILWQNLQEDLFRTSITPIKNMPPWESTNIEAKAAWYERLCYFVQDWQVNEPVAMQVHQQYRGTCSYTRDNIIADCVFRRCCDYSVL